MQSSNDDHGEDGEENAPLSISAVRSEPAEGEAHLIPDEDKSMISMNEDDSNAIRSQESASSMSSSVSTVVRGSSGNHDPSNSWTGAGTLTPTSVTPPPPFIPPPFPIRDRNESSVSFFFRGQSSDYYMHDDLATTFYNGSGHSTAAAGALSSSPPYGHQQHSSSSPRHRNYHQQHLFPPSSTTTTTQRLINNAPSPKTPRAPATPKSPNPHQPLYPTPDRVEAVEECELPANLYPGDPHGYWTSYDGISRSGETRMNSNYSASGTSAAVGIRHRAAYPDEEKQEVLGLEHGSGALDAPASAANAAGRFGSSGRAVAMVVEENEVPVTEAIWEEDEEKGSLMVIGGDGVGEGTAQRQRSDSVRSRLRADPDEDIVALKRQAYDPWHNPNSAPRLSVRDEASGVAEAQEAVIVSISDDDYPNYHPSDLSRPEPAETGAGVVAEWVGPSEHDTANDSYPEQYLGDSAYHYAEGHAPPVESSAVVTSYPSDPMDRKAPAVSTPPSLVEAMEEGDTEAVDSAHVTVIDDDDRVRSEVASAVSGGTAAAALGQPWAYDGEAQVMVETQDDGAAVLDAKLPSDQELLHEDNVVGEGDHIVDAVADVEAEVVDIQHDDDVHPSELARMNSRGVVQNDAEAEWVGVAATATAEQDSDNHDAVASSASFPYDNSNQQSQASQHQQQMPLTPTASAVASSPLDQRELQAPLTASTVRVLYGNGFATSKPQASRDSDGMYPGITNPFVDDPHDPPSLSRDALAQLDTQPPGQSTTRAPTAAAASADAVQVEDRDVAHPVAATLPVVSDDGGVAWMSFAGKTVASEAPLPLSTPPRKSVPSPPAPPPHMMIPPPRPMGAATRQQSLGDRVPEWTRTEHGEVQSSGVPPRPRPFGPDEPQTNTSQTTQVSALTTDSSGQRSAANNAGGFIQLSTSLARGTTQVMEALFGESRPVPASRSPLMTDGNRAAGHILSRVLLPSSVIYNPGKKMWVATLQTNQSALDSNNVAEASKSLRAFSLPSEKRAICLAQAWTPPRMHPFSENPTCHICDTRFAVFRRACHCRNCGVCVCRRECTVQWPSKMIPETYNHKKEAFVNICKTCDWLCHSFRLALLEGDFDKVVALHSTGNVNVNSSFGNVKGELFYPVHCAVLGGNLLLLKWLVDEHCCPIKSVRVSGKTSVNSGTYIPIVTSKGRSLLGIAMETCNVPIMRYLVVDKGTSVAGEKDITTSMLTESLTAVLYRLPADVLDGASPSARTMHNGASAPFDEDGSALSPLPPSSGRNISEGIREISDTFPHGQDSSDHENECIICCENKIDCVSNPCGHQIMCMSCAEHFSRCPVCASDCTFIRVYRS